MSRINIYKAWANNLSGFFNMFPVFEQLVAIYKQSPH